MAKIYRIYPGIGIARIGKHDEMFIGPESPSLPSAGPFKKGGKIKKQGARFRIYEFDVDEFGAESVVREITAAEASIEWSVHLCNRKAASRRVPKETGQKRNEGYDRNKLVIENQDRISGKNRRNPDLKGSIEFVRNGTFEGRDSVVLGRLETDQAGRLVVVGGHGVSKTPIGEPLVGFANNDGWYDDCCDGPVSANVVLNGQTVEVEQAWIVVASPAFAPDIRNTTTWYDQAKNVDAMHFHPQLMLGKPSFTSDIFPILESTYRLQWVSSDARSIHGEQGSANFLDNQTLVQLASESTQNQQRRQAIFDRLCEPGTYAVGPKMAPAPKNMPKLYSGVDPNDRTKFQHASLTQLQYLNMKKWADGDFVNDWQGKPAPVAFPKIPIGQQPHSLTKAALEACIGGPFYPGIESTYLMALSDTYGGPYRIDPSKPAGFLTELMAVPWQADYFVCGAFWWPAQRPVSVKVGKEFKEFSRGINNYSGMVQHWSNLGFIVESNDEFVETERGLI